MYEKIKADWVKARKEKKTQEATFLGTLKSQIDTALKKYPQDKVTEELTIKETETALKQFTKSVNQALNAAKEGRPDQVAQLENEKEWLSRYVPETLSEEKTRELVQRVITDNNISKKDFGMAMKLVSAYKGIDKKLASEVLKEML